VPELYLVGAGVRVPGQFTVEAIDALKRCALVFSVLPSHAEAELLRSFEIQPHSLWELYRADRVRRESYDEIARVILEAAETNSPVGYIAQGNPVVLDSVTATLLEGARSRGWSAVVLPGVSSIDTVLVDLEHEPASGLQIFDTGTLVARGIVLRSDTAALLLQPGAFATVYPALSIEDIESQRPALPRLRDHLLRSHPASLECQLVRSSTSAAGRPHIYRIQVGDLGDATAEALADTSLFIPAAPDR
jgi:precorrin-2 methylase